MEAQAKPPHSLAQHIHHTLRVILPLEADYKIIRIADKLHLSSQPWLNLVLEPPIKHIVKIDVAKKRRKHRALGGSSFRRGKLLAIQHAHMQALLDQPQKRPIEYPFPEHL